MLNEELEGLADTGANVSITNSVGLIDKLGLQILPVPLKIATADGTAYRCLGYVNMPFSLGSVTHVIPTLVVPELKKMLVLGVDFLDKFGIG